MKLSLAPAALALALSLAGCKAASGADPHVRGGCTHADAAATGPGDALGLFPASPGDLWAYDVDAGDGVSYHARVDATGLVTVAARRGVRLTDTPMHRWARGSTAVVEVGPGGVTVLESDEFDELAPGLGALVGPRLLLRLPAVAGDSYTSYACAGLRATTLEADELVIDVRQGVTVAGEEELTLPDGVHTALRVDTRVDLTIHAEGAAPQRLASEQRDWYVPGIGLARSRETSSSPGEPDTVATRQLFAWSVGTAAQGPVTRPVALPSGVLTFGEVARDGWQAYRVTVPPGDARVVLGLFPRDEALALGGSGGPTFVGEWDCLSLPSTAPVRCLIGSGTRTAAYVTDVVVDGAAFSGASASFAVLAGPWASLEAPATETVSLPLGQALPGQVGPRGTSIYRVTGLTPGVPFTVGLAGNDGTADLDEPNGASWNVVSCWVRPFGFGPAAESCTLVPWGDTLEVGVSAGAGEHWGATYWVAAW